MGRSLSKIVVLIFFVALTLGARAEEDLRITEFLASNSHTLADEDGDFSDWIEIYNSGANAVNLLDWSLTDNTGDLTAWRFPSTNIPPGSFLIVFASEKNRRVSGAPLHTNFKLSTDGEYLALVRPDGVTVISQYAPLYPVQFPDISYGLDVDTSSPRYFQVPTPGSANGVGSGDRGPIISNVRHVPALPSDSDNVIVTAQVQSASAPIGNVVLHYRVMFGNEVSQPMFDDGLHGEGAAGDGIFGASIPAIASTAGQMIRYYVTADDTADHTSRWPIFSNPDDSSEYLGMIVSDPSIQSRLPVIQLFVEDTGAADTRNGSRCAIFYAGEFYDHVLISLHGQSSTGWPKKSYNVSFPSDHRFQYQPNTPRLKDIKLLSNYGDKSKVHNSLAYEMIHEAGSDGHFAFHVRVQRNGQFFSVADLVEDGDDLWLERLGRDSNGALYKMYNNLGSASGNEKKTRKTEDFTDLQTLINNLDESRPLNGRVLYGYDNLDLPQVISYFAAQALISSQDHGHKNYYMYRDTPGTGEWAIFPWDIDLSWGRNWLDAQGYFTDTLFQNNVLNFYNSSQQGKPSNRLYNLIFTHPDFRRMYLRRLRTIMDTVLQPPGTPAAGLRIESRIRQMMDLLDPSEITTSDADLDYAKWGVWGAKRQMRAEAMRIIDIHLPGRRDFLYNNPEATLNGERIPQAQPADVSINFGTIEYNPASGNQAEEYICLTNQNPYAVDISGWRLSGGLQFTFRPGTVIPANSGIYVSPDVKAFRARSGTPRGGEGLFVQGPYKGQLSARGETLTVIDNIGRIVTSQTYEGSPSAAQQSLRITELMYHPAPLSGATQRAEAFEYIELKNIGPAPLDLNGIHFTNGIVFNFTGSQIRNLTPGEFVLVVKDIEAFTARYGTNRPIAGQYLGRMDDRGETIRLDDSMGEKILEFTYQNSWYPVTDGLGFSLVIIDENAPWDTWNSNASWRASAEMGGSPGRADPPPFNADRDGDGLSDSWEIENGTNPDFPDANADPDGDGFTNVQEYVAGTNPTDASSYLRLDRITANLGTNTLQFLAISNRTYTIQYKDSLSLKDWSKLIDVNTASTSRLETISDPNSALSGRFYRLVTPALR